MTYVLPVSGGYAARQQHEAAVNAELDAMRNQIAANGTGLTPRGSWAASGTFPAGSAKGDFWIVSTAGTVGGQAFATGDWLIALVAAAPITVFAANWARGDYSKVLRRIYDNPMQMIASVETSRGVGAVWQAGPFEYVEAASGAIDHQIITTGGGAVKLYARPDTEGRVMAEQLGSRALLTPPIQTIRPNGEYAVERFGVFPENVGTGSPPWTDQRTRLQDAFDAAGDGSMIRMGPGVIGVNGTLTLRKNSKFLGVDHELSRIVNASPYVTSVVSESNGGAGVANVTFGQLFLDGGWDKKKNGIGTNWNFDHMDPVFDNIYGLDLWSTFSSTSIGAVTRLGAPDSRNYLPGLRIGNVAGTGHRRAGRGAGFTTQLVIGDCARYCLLWDGFVDDHLYGVELSKSGGAAFRSDGSGTGHISDAKFWYVGQCKIGTPAKGAVELIGVGATGLIMKGIDIADTSVDGIYLEGMAHTIDVTMKQIGQGQSLGFGHPTILAGFHLNFGSSNDCMVQINGFNNDIAVDTESRVKLSNFSGNANNNVVEVNGNANRLNQRKPFYKASIPFQEAPAIRSSKLVNWVKGTNGTLLFNGNLTGLTTLMMNDPTHAINAPTMKQIGTKHWLADIEKTVVSTGNTASSAWTFEATGQIARTNVVSIRASPVGLTGAVYGDRYLIDPSPSGAWAAQANNILTYRRGPVTVLGSWRIDVPLAGQTAYDASQGITLSFNGTAWVYDPVATFGLVNGTIPLASAGFVNTTGWTLGAAAVAGPGYIDVPTPPGAAQDLLTRALGTTHTNVWIVYDQEAASVALIRPDLLSPNIIGGGGNKRTGMAAAKFTRSSQTSFRILANAGYDGRIDAVQVVGMDSVLAMPCDIWITAGEQAMGTQGTGNPVDTSLGDGWADPRCLYMPGSTNAAYDVATGVRQPSVIPLQGASGISYSGVSPAHRFQREMLAATAAGRAIVILHCTAAGSSVVGTAGEWNPAGSTGAGATLYNNMVTRATEAFANCPAGSVIKGLIWAGGQADVGTETAVRTNLRAMITALRTALSLASLKVAVLGPNADIPAYDVLAAELAKLDKDSAVAGVALTNCIYVAAPGGYDETGAYMTAAGSRELGKRTADAWKARL